MTTLLAPQHCSAHGTLNKSIWTVHYAQCQSVCVTSPLLCNHLLNVLWRAVALNRFLSSFWVNANSRRHKAAIKQATAGLIEAVNLEPVSSTDLHWHRRGMPADELTAYKNIKRIIDMHGVNLEERTALLWSEDSSLAAVALRLGCDPDQFLQQVTIDRVNALASTAPAPGVSQPTIGAEATEVLWMWYTAADSLLRDAHAAEVDPTSLSPQQLVNIVLTPTRLLHQVEVRAIDPLLALAFTYQHIIVVQVGLPVPDMATAVE